MVDIALCRPHPAYRRRSARVVKRGVPSRSGRRTGRVHATGDGLLGAVEKSAGARTWPANCDPVQDEVGSPGPSRAACGQMLEKSRQNFSGRNTRRLNGILHANMRETRRYSHDCAAPWVAPTARFMYHLRWNLQRRSGKSLHMEYKTWMYLICGWIYDESYRIAGRRHRAGHQNGKTCPSTGPVRSAARARKTSRWWRSDARPSSTPKTPTRRASSDRSAGRAGHTGLTAPPRVVTLCGKTSTIRAITGQYRWAGARVAPPAPVRIDRAF